MASTAGELLWASHDWLLCSDKSLILAAEEKMSEGLQEEIKSMPTKTIAHHFGISSQVPEKNLAGVSTRRACRSSNRRQLSEPGAGTPHPFAESGRPAGLTCSSGSVPCRTDRYPAPNRRVGRGLSTHPEYRWPK